MLSLLQKIFGSKKQRDIKALRPLVKKINEIELQYQSLTDEQLRGKTQEFKDRLAHGETLDDVMCEAFAAVKNACRRLCGQKFIVCQHEKVWDMVPFDVQLIGGMVLHKGKIAEMATGEGKTLVATMPLYLNALTGKNVNLVTVNDYLARRDAQWMGQVYNFLGLTCGCIQNQMSPAERRAEYAKDITYGTNSEFGFDYLRDNGMACHPDEQVQRNHYFAIVDEVDSILIDEARTPLIISGPAPVSSHQYLQLKPKVEELVRMQRMLCNRLIAEAKDELERGDKDAAMIKLYQVHHGMPKHTQLMHMLENPDVRKLLEQVRNMMLTDMRKEHARELREELYFGIDEKGRDASLTEKGCQTLNPTDPDAYVLPDLVTAIADLEADHSLSERDKVERRREIQADFTTRSEMIHNVDQLIKAYCVYERDVEYVVQDNQVLIVDEFTGRILPGRRWSDGLHQAVEAKEGVKIERETQTLATITIQNYFRLYEKLAGMTGTAETEAGEFNQIYKLDVVVIPTNRPARRIDYNDLIYKTQREKYKAVIEDIEECHSRGQPVLVGTVSVDTSELLSRMLKRSKIPHNVLNAKIHDREADIVALAGQPGAVTIATNMAGRGTDIKLGEGVVSIDRSIITSGRNLEEKVDGKSLRELLMENPSGLHVIGSERHEARRIDRQLRGRCARQGDPGSSRFYVSLEDDLMRMFGSDRLAGFMSKMGMQEGEPIEHKWLNRSIETAQKRVEQHHFSIRKRTLEYDDVMNKQRQIVYEFRGDIVRTPNVRQQVYDILEDVIYYRSEQMLNPKNGEGPAALIEWVFGLFPVALTEEELKPLAGNSEAVGKLIYDRVRQAYDLKMDTEDAKLSTLMERQIVLQTIDTHWQDYLRAMDALREGVHLRAYGQQDPLVEYKREAFRMFEELMGSIKDDIAGAVFKSTTNIQSYVSFLQSLPQKLVHEQVSVLGGSGSAVNSAADREPEHAQPQGMSPKMTLPIQRSMPKVGRNDDCPCGSGKKYKKCCGK